MSEREWKDLEDSLCEMFMKGGFVEVLATIYATRACMKFRIALDKHEMETVAEVERAV